MEATNIVDQATGRGLQVSDPAEHPAVRGFEADLQDAEAEYRAARSLWFLPDGNPRYSQQVLDMDNNRQKLAAIEAQLAERRNEIFAAAQARQAEYASEAQRLNAQLSNPILRQPTEILQRIEAIRPFLDIPQLENDQRRMLDQAELRNDTAELLALATSEALSEQLRARALRLVNGEEDSKLNEQLRAAEIARGKLQIWLSRRSPGRDAKLRQKFPSLERG